MLTICRTDDLTPVEELLAAHDLPTADVHSGAAQFFEARLSGEVVGVGGFEAFGSDGLLRSIVVREPMRGSGYGTDLCDELEARAAGVGVSRLYLLTTSAESFFGRRGYETVPRESVPARISEKPQFEDLSPSSATVMTQALVIG